MWGSFSGEDPDIAFEDWLPALQRAAAWNDGRNEEKLLQLAGHMRGRALQEWNLLQDSDRTTFEAAVGSLKTRLDPVSRALAAQDFRHTTQRDQEPVFDFIRRLEQTFRLAYGKEGMSSETRDMLLHSQLQEGLCYDLMKAPAVSGAQGYRQLCLAARNEEMRLAELGKRRQYRKQSTAIADRPSKPSEPRGTAQPPSGTLPVPGAQSNSGSPRRCFKCGLVGHMARNCTTRRAHHQPVGPPPTRNHAAPCGAARQVHTTGSPEMHHEWSPQLLECLCPSDPEDTVSGVREVRVN